MTEQPKPEMPREIYLSFDNHPDVMEIRYKEIRDLPSDTAYLRADLSPDSELLEALEVAEKLLSEHQTYSDDDGEEYNNNRIIEAVSKIRKTIAKHTGKTG